MKYSLHERLCSGEYLKQADEIVIEYRDRKALPDYYKKYPNAQFMLEILPNTEWEYDEIRDYFNLSKGRLVICLPDLKDEKIEMLKEDNIPFFWGYTATTFWELESIIKTGVSQVRIGAPIFFECDKLENFKIEKRITANMAHSGYFNDIDGIIGPWIRPEDVDFYTPYFDTIEFLGCENKQEEAMFRIYAEQKEWPGRLDMIIKNIDTNAYNRLIPGEFAEARLNCGQRCAAKGSCHICYRLLKLADKEFLREYKEEVLDKKELN